MTALLRLLAGALLGGAILILADNPAEMLGLAVLLTGWLFLNFAANDRADARP